MNMQSQCFEKDEVELLELAYGVDDDILETQGKKKYCTFGMYSEDCLKSVEQLNKIIESTKSVRFSSEINPR